MKGKIYKITNNINNKVYIGKTYDTVQRRFKQHILNSNSKNLEYINRPLYRAMRKHGTENFLIELIGEYEEGLLEKMEIKFISKYNSYKDGYNATLGGDGKRTFEYSDEEVIEKYKELKYLSKTAEYFNCDRATIKKILLSNNITVNRCSGAKKIAKLDKNTLEILETFNSITEAAIKLGNTNKHRHISDACNGRRITAYGFK